MKTCAYSVTAADLEEARSWVEEATGLTAEGRESSYLGGDYYFFDGEGGEEVQLFKNRDLFDRDPIIGESAEWKIALLVEDAEPASPIFGALELRPDQFKKMQETEY